MIMRAVFVTAMLLADSALADGARDQEAYCAYVMHEANAQKIYLLAPRVESGVYQQPISSGSTQTFLGFSNSLSDDFKSRLVMKAAGKDCELYRATVEVQQQIQFALPRIEKDAMRKKLALIQQARDRMDAMIREGQDRVAAQNLTVSSLYSVQYEKTRLELQKAQVQLMLATTYVPEVGNESLRELVVRKHRLEIEKQQADHRVISQENWDVALTAGVHHDLSGFTTGAPDGYGGINLKYSFGARARGQELEKAASAYGDWKDARQGDALEGVNVLRQQITESIVVQEAAVMALQSEEAQINGSIESLAHLDTSAAVAFANRLSVDKLTLGIELQTVQYRLARLREYLAENF
jgi:hypothetical protein